MPLNEFTTHRPSVRAYHERNLVSWLRMASVYRRATEERDVSAAGHWGSGKYSFSHIAQALQGHNIHVFCYSLLYRHALVPFPFQVQVSRSPRSHLP